MILGATGRIGRPLVREVRHQGAAVVAVSRSSQHAEQDKVRWVALSPDDVEGQRKIFERADAIIDARNQRYDDWSAYPAMIRTTLSALGQSGVPYTYVDNVYGYGRPHGDSVKEDAPRLPVSRKGRYRVEVEGLLFRAVESGRRVQIVRFPDFYGISTDSLGQGFLRWFGPPILAHQFIHIPDAAHAAWLLTSDSEAPSGVWHVAGDSPIAAEPLREIAQSALKRPVRLRVFPCLAVAAAGMANPQIRGLVETQYLWRTPLALNTEKFESRYGTEFRHSHQYALEEICAAIL